MRARAALQIRFWFRKHEVRAQEVGARGATVATGHVHSGDRGTRVSSFSPFALFFSVSWVGFFCSALFSTLSEASCASPRVSLHARFLSCLCVSEEISLLTLELVSLSPALSLLSSLRCSYGEPRGEVVLLQWSFYSVQQFLCTHP